MAQSVVRRRTPRIHVACRKEEEEEEGEEEQKEEDEEEYTRTAREDGRGKGWEYTKNIRIRECIQS